MKRGELWWADIEPRSGSEQRGRRPVVVLSHDAFNTNPAWRSLIVIPLTTASARARQGPTAILLAAADDGLTRESIALCHQVTTLDRSKLAKPIGRLGEVDLARIERGVRAALDLA